MKVKRKLELAVIILVFSPFFLYQWQIYLIIGRHITINTKLEDLIFIEKKAAEYPALEKHLFIVRPLIGELKPQWWNFGKDVRPFPVVYALIRLGEPAAKPLIAELNDLKVREDAIYILSRIKNKSADVAKLLILSLKSKSVMVREGAARALGTLERCNYRDWAITFIFLGEKVNKEPSFEKVRYTEAIEPLIAVLKDKNPLARESAAISLAEIARRHDLGQDYNRWLQWSREQNK